MTDKRPVIKVNRRVVWDRLARLNITQNDMARRVGISSAYLSRLISGKRSPSPGMRVRLLQALDYPAFEDLFIVVSADE